MQILTWSNGPFMVNTYMIISPGKDVVILDPGSDIETLFAHIDSEGLNPIAVIATHGHIDHVTGVGLVKERFNIPFLCNDADRFLIEQILFQARMFGVTPVEAPEIDQNLPSEGLLNLGEFEFQCLHTPGHSPGSVSLLIENSVFTGDALFRLSIGRTDLPGGDYHTLIKSIKEKLMVLPEETIVLPGHGESTTIGQEKRENPYI